jgi:hypothetical protein
MTPTRQNHRALLLSDLARPLPKREAPPVLAAPRRERLSDVAVRVAARLRRVVAR